MPLPFRTLEILPRSNASAGTVASAPFDRIFLFCIPAMALVASFLRTGIARGCCPASTRVVRSAFDHNVVKGIPRPVRTSLSARRRALSSHLPTSQPSRVRAPHNHRARKRHIGCRTTHKPERHGGLCPPNPPGYDQREGGMYTIELERIAAKPTLAGTRCIQYGLCLAAAGAASRGHEVGSGARLARDGRHETVLNWL